MANAQNGQASHGFWIIAVGLALVLAIGKCASSEDKTARSFASPSLTSQIEAMPSPTPAPIAGLSLKSLKTGRRHFAAVMDGEGLSGAMIYSQNCYDAVSREFSWAKLDQCGGFDVLAVKAVDGADGEGLTAELDYFGPEAVAGRYLAVATKAGEVAGDADKRLEDLQRRAAPLTPPVSRREPQAEEQETPVDEADPLGNEAVEAPVEV